MRSYSKNRVMFVYVYNLLLISKLVRFCRDLYTSLLWLLMMILYIQVLSLERLPIFAKQSE